MTARPLRLGIVGCGRLAEHGYVPAAASLESVRVVAVADLDEGRRDLVASLVRVTHGTCDEFRDAAALLAGAEVDALVVASPSPSHLADAIRATDAGVAVLVEKPLAPDASGARDLAALRPAPWAAFNRRFDAGALAVLARVPPTGDLDVRLEIAYRRRSWRAITVHDDALLDLGPHLIDWARWLTRSDVIEVRDAVVTDERADFELTLARGRAHVRASTDRLHRELIDVSDATGARVARHRVGGPSAAIVARFRRGPHPLVTTLRAQLDAFARAMVGGDAGNLGTADDAAAVMTVVDAVRASAASGAPISVRERVAP